jgi:transcriptional regulator with XRE-family HTH domain
MDTTTDIAQFLASRRAKVTPEQAGLPTYGKRRVPGLRREEVASLAGVSIDYYRRLERGNVNGVSDSVLEALARALQLDDAERAPTSTTSSARRGTKHIHHPVVGDLELSYETMDLSADAGLNLAVYTAEAGSASQQALDLLASWTATIDQTAAAGVDGAEAR